MANINCFQDDSLHTNHPPISQYQSFRCQLPLFVGAVYRPLSSLLDSTLREGQLGAWLISSKRLTPDSNAEQDGMQDTQGDWAA